MEYNTDEFLMKKMFAIALGMTKLETFMVLFSSIIFIGAFTWVSIKGDLRKIAEELVNDNNSES